MYFPDMNISKYEDRVDISIKGIDGKYRILNFSLEEFNRLANIVYEL